MQLVVLQTASDSPFCRGNIRTEYRYNYGKDIVLYILAEQDAMVRNDLLASVWQVCKPSVADFHVLILFNNLLKAQNIQSSQVHNENNNTALKSKNSLSVDHLFVLLTGFFSVSRESTYDASSLANSTANSTHLPKATPVA